LTSIRNIHYITGQYYCVLSIAKKEAEAYGIGNSQEVEIKPIKNGLLIQNKNASAHNTGQLIDADVDFRDIHGVSSNVRI
jgi:hypothetical protein